MRYVLFHSNCYDGHGAAFAAWKFWGDTNTSYRSVSYGYPVPDMPDATEVFILDFCYPKAVIDELSKRVQVTILDHHKTAQEDLKELDYEDLTGKTVSFHKDHSNPPFKPRVLFDMTRSGAKITWEYLHGTPPPLLIEHISDRDLWNYKLPGTSEFHKALVSYPMDFKVWDTLNIEQMKIEGVTCDRLYASIVRNICDSSWLGEFDGHKVAIVNTSMAWSEVGQLLLEKYPECQMVLSFTVFQDQTMYSIRSRTGFDCSVIAKKFGGGGHVGASGFKIKHDCPSITDLPFHLE
jgi:uncharacterized protein